MILLKEPSEENTILTLHVTTETHFLLGNKPKHIIDGIVKMYVMRCPFFWTTFLYDLALSSIDKLFGMSIGTLNNINFDNMVIQNYPTHLQLNKANISDTQDSFVSISNDIVSTNKYDKRANFDFEIVNFPF